VATFIKVTPNMTGGTLRGYWYQITGTSSLELTVYKSWSTSTENTRSKEIDHTFETAESITVESGKGIEAYTKVAATVSSKQSSETKSIVSSTITTANEGSAESKVTFDCPNGQGWVFKVSLESQLSTGTQPPTLTTDRFVCVPAGARNSQVGPMCTQPTNCCSTKSEGDGCQRCHTNPWDKIKSPEDWQEFQDLHPLLKTNPDADLCYDETTACVNYAASKIGDVVCFDTHYVYYNQPRFPRSPIQLAHPAGITQLDLENCAEHASTSVKDRHGKTVSTNNYCWTKLYAGQSDCESYVQSLTFQTGKPQVAFEDCDFPAT
jgi:hypothetical protein